MAIVHLRWPWLGIAIPSFLISFIGYCSHFFVFRYDFSIGKQIIFELAVLMVWLSYYLAIVTHPGSPPKDFNNDQFPNRLAWKRWCKKCSNYKPERCHHCKSCRCCVLKMDHHCPWTMNCVGYENTPHFLRFLFWVEITSSFVLYELGKKLILIVKNSNLPAYLFNITELIFVIILVLLDFMMFATITILLIRVLYGIGFSGMTQIEIWERERLESQFFTKRLWRQISKNYYQQYGKFLDLSKLTTWTNTGTNSLKTSGHYLTENLAENHILGNDVDVDINDDDEEKDETETGIEMRNLKTTDIDNIEPPQNFTIDDIIFPYDISFYQNLTNSLGPWYLWLYPWSKAPHTPTNNGLIFEIEGNFAEDDQLGLPWPPDGGNQNVCATGTDENIAFTRSITDKNSLKKKIKFVDPRLSLKRTEWYNEFGEGLGDFGVDVDAEDDYDDTSVNKKYAEQEDGVGNSTGN